LGIGSIFKVSIPFQVVKTQDIPVYRAPEIPSIVKPSEIQRTILIVEDDKVNQFVARQILQKREYEILIANNGQECLEILAERADIDLILMDLNMPILDGFAATKKIREMAESISKIPIIAITADAFEETKITVLEAGMNHFITKPISLKDLFIAIDEVIS
jgi:CheY-like chemotaxis protein